MLLAICSEAVLMKCDVIQWSQSCCAEYAEEYVLLMWWIETIMWTELSSCTCKTRCLMMEGVYDIF